MFRFRIPLRTPFRRPPPFTRPRLARATLGLSLAGASSLGFATLHADSSTDNANENVREPLSALIRAYIVYSICSFPALVDASPAILSTLSSVPVLKQITEAVVRVTFFNQFVGGDTAEDALPLIRSLRSSGKGTLFAYSVEVDENEATAPSSSSSSLAQPGRSDAHKRIVDEMVHCIDVSADFEASLPAPSGAGASPPIGRTWVAVKVTALLPDANALIALSKRIVDSRRSLPHSEIESVVPFPGAPRLDDLDILFGGEQSTLHHGDTRKPVDPETGLSPKNLTALRELYADLRRICTRASERGVKVIVDAEYSWYQPAIDALTLALMREFNALRPPSSSSNSSSNSSSTSSSETASSSSSADTTSSPHQHNQPLIYATYQAYLRRTPLHLTASLADARKHGYALGVKLVRGAYHVHEVAAHRARARARSGSRYQGQVQSEGSQVDDESSSSSSSGKRKRNEAYPSLSISPDPEPPVWLSKLETDTAYDRCVCMLVRAVAEDVRAQAISSAVKGQESQVRAESRSWTSWFGFGGFGGFGRGKKGEGNAEVEVKQNKEDVPTLAVLFGTHNRQSCSLVLDELVRNGLARECGVSSSSSSSSSNSGSASISASSSASHSSSTPNPTPKDSATKLHIPHPVLRRIAIGQLYGMSDDLTDWIVGRVASASSSSPSVSSQSQSSESSHAHNESTIPLVLKYVPYGALAEVMPYLSRRAVENKSVLGGGGEVEGGAKAERRRAGREVWRRVVG